MSIQDQYDFEEFEETPKRKADIPKATISKSGLVMFNKKFADQFGEELLRSHVVFFYDRKNRVIGLRETPSPEHNSYPVRSVATGKALAVTARAFLKHYGIDFKKSRSYAVETSKGGEGKMMIYINLGGKWEAMKHEHDPNIYGVVKDLDKK